MAHGDLVIEGEWDFMLGEGVKGLLDWWQAEAQVVVASPAPFASGASSVLVGSA